MSVFISWSGKDSRSHKVALLLKNWLPKVLQKLQCFVSSHDIEAGANWMRTLFSQLESSNVGIICLTQESLSKPWILFEAGALAKKVNESRVCPLLIDVSDGEVGLPLGAFQLKKTTQEDMRSLLEMINNSREEPLSPAELDDTFLVRWPQFEADLKNILKVSDVAPQKEPRVNPTEAIGEILTIVRGIAAGRIVVNSENVETVTHGDLFYLSPTEREVVPTKRAVTSFVHSVQKKRPLIAEWLKTYTRAEICGDTCVLYFPSKDFAFDALSNPKQKEFLQSELQQVANLRLEIKKEGR